MPSLGGGTRNLYSRRGIVTKGRKMLQLTMWDTETRIRRDDGINRAVKHANCVDPHWSDSAYDLLVAFLVFHPNPFLTEDVREYAEQHGVPIPPSKRAWGGIVIRAAKEGLIKKIGYRNTTNPKSHATPATEWIRNEDTKTS